MDKGGDFKLTPAADPSGLSLLEDTQGWSLHSCFDKSHLSLSLPTCSLAEGRCGIELRSHPNLEVKLASEESAGAAVEDSEGPADTRMGAPAPGAPLAL